MPKLKYAITRSGPKRLEIAYPFGIGKATVRLDGKDLGTIKDRKALKAGGDVKLPDGSTVNVKLVSNLLGSELHVSRNGRPVAGSAGDPHKRLADAAGAFYFIAVVNIVVGLGTAIFRLEFLRSVSGGWISVIFGLIFAGIGYGVADGSRAALGVGLLIFLVDTGLLVGATVTEGYQLGFAGMLLRAYLLYAMVRGFPAIDGVKAEDVQDEADVRAAKNLPPQNPPRVWSPLEKTLIVIVCIMVVGVTSLLSILAARPAPRQQAVVRPTNPPATIAPTITAGGPTSTPTPPPAPVVTYPDYVLSGIEGVKAIDPLPIINLPDKPKDKPLFEGDLAWNKPTFASSYFTDNYPTLATSGGIGWRTAQSSGAWFYVDLGERQLIHQLIVSNYVDGKFTNAPQTYFISTIDLQSPTWHILAAETNYANSYARNQPRVINFEQDLYMRYVGIYAYDWKGGYGSVETFAVIPTGYDYTTEEVQAAVS